MLYWCWTYKCYSIFGSRFELEVIHSQVPYASIEVNRNCVLCLSVRVCLRVLLVCEYRCIYHISVTRSCTWPFDFHWSLIWENSFQFCPIAVLGLEICNWPRSSDQEVKEIHMLLVCRKPTLVKWLELSLLHPSMAFPFHTPMAFLLMPLCTLLHTSLFASPCTPLHALHMPFHAPLFAPLYTACHTSLYIPSTHPFAHLPHDYLLWCPASYQPCYWQNSAAPSSFLYNSLQAQQTHDKNMQKVF